MRIISKGKEPTAALWYHPPSQTGIYRLMQYHVKTECEEGTLLLNTVTGELVLLDKEEQALLDRFPAPYEAGMNELAAHRFLVPDSFDELKSVIQLKRIVRNLTSPKDKVDGFTILPTSACNARCFYCYESDYPRYTMTENICEKTAEYIASHCGKAKKVHLSWFGGEPTLGEKWIDGICDRLRERNISFTSSMISNGYLFSRAMARKAKEKWQLQNIQITLDGTEEVYNRVKSYVNAEGSPYQRVIGNIGFLLDEKIRVSVRMNLDRHNADNLKALIDELAARFSQYDAFSMYVHEIFDSMGYQPIRRSERELQEIMEIKLALDDYIDGKGLERSAKDAVKKLPCLKLSYCMADNPNSVQINPAGELGKCQHMQYEHLVGDLWNGIAPDREGYLYWMESPPRQGCDQCPLCPSCGVPESCASGRTCIQVEVNRKLDAVREFCRKVFINNCSNRRSDSYGEA